MTRPESEESFKTTVGKWQTRANERRQNNARRAGVGWSSDNFEEYVKRISSEVTNDKANESVDPKKKKKRKSLAATRMSHPNEEFDIAYHEPIKVRFESPTDISSK